MDDDATRALYATVFECGRRAGETGVWWEPAWWRLPSALPGDVSVAAFDAAVARVRRTFDADWFLRNGGHSFAATVMNVGTMGIYDVMLMADELAALDAAQGDAVHVEARLKSQAEYRGARREALAVWLLAQSGLQVEVAQGRQPGADIRTINASTDFAVEATGIEIRDAERRVQDLLSKICQALSEGLHPRGYDLILDGHRVADVRGQATCADAIPAVLTEVACVIDNLRERPDGDELEIAGLGRVRVVPGGMGSRASGPAFDREKMSFKAASSAIAKESQLPYDRPGVVLLEFPFGRLSVPHAAEILDRKLIANRPKTDRIAGVVFVTGWQSGAGVHYSLRAHDNPNASVRLSALPWSSVNEPGGAR